jgi:hypothetical protein
MAKTKRKPKRDKYAANFIGGIMRKQDEDGIEVAETGIDYDWKTLVKKVKSGKINQ